MIGARGVLAVAVTGLLLLAGVVASPEGRAQDEDGFALKVIPGGKGSVTVAAAGLPAAEPCRIPAGGVSTEACNSRFPAGTKITLTANSDAGPFRGWSTASCRSGRTCTFRITADTNVVARFDQVVVTLAKDAGGSVSSALGSISCGAGCTQDAVTLKQGTKVTLTAAPAGEFQGWSGPCGTTEPTCTFRAVFNLTVGAGFLELPQAPVGDPGELTVRVMKRAGGTVYARAPEGGDPIRCPSACRSGGFDVYDTVRFRAVANKGYSHKGWSQSCTRVCVISVTKATSIYAKFVRRRR